VDTRSTLKATWGGGWGGKGRGETGDQSLLPAQGSSHGKRGRKPLGFPYAPASLSLGFWDGRTAEVAHFGVDAFGANEQTKLARAGVDFVFCLSKTLASYLLAGNVFS
jgi:hypothetical protein